MSRCVFLMMLSMMFLCSVIAEDGATAAAAREGSARLQQHLQQLLDTIPPLVNYALLTFITLIVLVTLVTYITRERAPPFRLAGAHAFITGGSSGIGYETARQLLLQGAHVTIVARDPTRLERAAAQLRASIPPANPFAGKVRVLAYSCDTTQSASLHHCLTACTRELGPITVFVGCAGTSEPGYFEETDESTFERVMQVNLFGLVRVLKQIVPDMKARRNGRILLVSSMAGLTAVFGYTAYSASKFAVRGFAEALHMELAPYNVWVSLVHPPDVDTPLLAEENKNKPIECRLISEGSGLWSAESIARSIVDACQHWRFFVNYGLDGTMLGLLACGTRPADSIGVALVEWVALGWLRVVSGVYHWSFRRIVERVRRERRGGKHREIRNTCAWKVGSAAASEGAAAAATKQD